MYIAVDGFKTNSHEIGKYILLFLCVAGFILAGVEHCIANMFYFSFALEDLSPWLILNLVLATLGNSLGAIAVNEFTKVVK